jgi:hypothetical protein
MRSAANWSCCSNRCWMLTLLMWLFSCWISRRSCMIWSDCVSLFTLCRSPPLIQSSGMSLSLIVDSFFNLVDSLPMVQHRQLRPFKVSHEMPKISWHSTSSFASAHSNWCHSKPSSIVLMSYPYQSV